MIMGVTVSVLILLSLAGVLGWSIYFVHHLVSLKKKRSMPKTVTQIFNEDKDLVMERIQKKAILIGLAVIIPLLAIINLISLIIGMIKYGAP